MKSYVIFDSTANLVDSFDSEEEARSALERIVRQDPNASRDYAMVPVGEDGLPNGDVVTGADLNVSA